jgi:hypothetical protein
LIAWKYPREEHPMTPNGLMDRSPRHNKNIKSP